MCSLTLYFLLLELQAFSVEHDFFIILIEFERSDRAVSAFDLLSKDPWSGVS